MISREHLKFWQKFYKIRYWASITERQTAREISFIKEFLPLYKYKNILDFICGFGRHALGLARIGYKKVEGFDIDRKSINKAKKQIKLLKLKNIKFYAQDALKFNKKSFDTTVCLYSSIGFLDEKSNERVFKNLFRSVKIDGRIILDVMNQDYAIKHLVLYSEKERKYEGKNYLLKHKRKILYNPVRERNVIEILDKEKNKKYITSYTLRLYSTKELERKFKENGFIIKRKFGSFAKERISKDHERIIIIADRIK